ncbi:RNA polymerase sigma70 [Candidatus Zixiibacteriota bacterium]|nr:RNA polymerase sigma70 [candidate division Zixibacteria bacterium]
MAQDWKELTKLTEGQAMAIERVRLTGRNIVIEGDFELPPLARLTQEDQVFVAAFVRTHGSIKEMEQLFGVSYPTIKSRLNRIGELLNFVKFEAAPAAPKNEILDRLEKGDITAKEAIEILKGKKGGKDV